MDELLPTARDLMTQEYLVVPPSLGLVDAIERLAHDPEDTAFVLDGEERFLGVLTEKECLHVLSARAYDDAIADTVADVMCTSPAALSPATDVYAIAQGFLTCACAVLPVIENGRVIGAVSQLTMLRTFVGVFRHRAAAQGEVEQTAEDLKGRPESKERMQRVFSHLDRDQLASLMRRHD
jgi:DeoR family transcriptional regulator, catabolite repression regulator